MEEILKENGFESLKEFNQIISNIDLSTNENTKLFEEWKHNDGTKKGLIKNGLLKPNN